MVARKRNQKREIQPSQKANPCRIKAVDDDDDDPDMMSLDQSMPLSAKNPVFSNIRVISAFKRHKNLEDLLTHPRLDYHEPEAALTTCPSLILSSTGLRVIAFRVDVENFFNPLFFHRCRWISPC